MTNPNSLNNQVPISQTQQWITIQPQQTQVIYNTQFANGAPIQTNGSGIIMGNGRVAPMGQPLPSIGDLGQSDFLPTDLMSISNLDTRFGDTDLDAIMRTL